MKILLNLCGIALLLLGTSVTTRAAVRVNEVLVNEPGGSTSLEWFELFNDSRTSSVSMAFYVVAVDGAAIGLQSLPSIPPEGYLIVCKSLSTFEAAFGDGSGTWGDIAAEQGQLVEATDNFGLSNSGGRVAAVRVTPPETDSVVWTSPGSDGVSLERITVISGGLAESVDPTGSTPGFVNSVTPVEIDLALDSVSVAAIAGGSQLSISISNRGRQTVSSGEIIVYAVNPADTSDRSDLITGVLLPPIDSGQAVLQSLNVLRSARYDTVGVSLSSDDRNRNNTQYLTVAGGDFPPVILSEFFANPSGQYTVEWVEVVNRSNDLINIADWLLGDATGLQAISADPFVLLPEEFIVIAENVSSLQLEYPEFRGRAVEPAGWQTLNDAGDIVRLVDAFGIEADRFEYLSTFSDGRTWASEGAFPNRIWGRSAVDGGTPGDTNAVRLAPSASGLEVEMEPRIISPDGNGIDDVAVFVVAGPPDVSYSIRLFDRFGRQVRTFEDDSVDLLPEYVWDGRDGGGVRLPIGVYVLLVEAEGVESVKHTLVIAR